MTTVARCPVCDRQIPARDRTRGGRKARYCSGACKAKAYRDRQQAGELPAMDPARLSPSARHARAVEIRQQVSELAGALADTASGQQALCASPGATGHASPAAAAQPLRRLVTELAALAAAATVTKRRSPHRRRHRPVWLGRFALDLALAQINNVKVTFRS